MPFSFMNESAAKLMSFQFYIGPAGSGAPVHCKRAHSCSMIVPKLQLLFADVIETVARLFLLGCPGQESKAVFSTTVLLNSTSLSLLTFAGAAQSIPTRSTTSSAAASIGS